MIITERSLKTIEYPLTKSNVLVIGSGHSRVTAAYHNILSNELSDALKIDNCFYFTGHGLVESLANDNDKDRIHFVKLLKKYFAKKIEHVVIFTDICIGEKNEEFYNHKRDRRKRAALLAKDYIKHLFREQYPELKIYCIIITVDGEKKTPAVIVNSDDEFLDLPFKSSLEVAQSI